MENSETTQPTVVSTGLKYGLIVALVSIAFNLVLIALGSNPYQNDWWKGVIGVAITVIVIVFAHKNFKENGDGFMSYGQGLGIAVVAILVSTVISIVFSYVYLNFIDRATWDEIWTKAAEDMELKGQSDQQIELGLEWGKKLFYVIYFVFGAFFGLVIGLIVSIFTQKSRPEQRF